MWQAHRGANPGDLVERRIQPLQACVHPMYEYEGPHDATQSMAKPYDQLTLKRMAALVVNVKVKGVFPAMSQLNSILPCRSM